MALTRDDANKAIDAAVKKAQELNIKISVAVCDPGGRLLAFNRMDGMGWAAVYGCQARPLRRQLPEGPAGPYQGTAPSCRRSPSMRAAT